MSNSSSSSSGGIGFCGLLALIFITLKLGIGNTAVVGWSWLWVLSPLWIPLAIVLGIVLIGAIVYGIAKAFS